MKLSLAYATSGRNKGKVESNNAEVLSMNLEQVAFDKLRAINSGSGNYYNMQIIIKLSDCKKNASFASYTKCDMQIFNDLEKKTVIQACQRALLHDFLLLPTLALFVIARLKKVVLDLSTTEPTSAKM